MSDATQRSLAARVAAYASHAGHNGLERTAPARRAAEQRYYDMVHERWPEITDKTEIARRAKILKSEHYARIALMAHKTRAANKARKRGPK